MEVSGTSIDRMKEQEIILLARRYFQLGFIGLPWLWLVNFIYIYPAIRKRPNLSPVIRKYAIYSLIGSLVWLVVIAAWLSVYLTRRNSWGAFGDKISVNIPLGK
ncbi:hypothetical protein BDV3_006651 [Batrachochytrium dendrobatidis]|nr:hypothetical protein QVD99_007239 [Batrachochytrium dendrobatidis]